VDTTTDVELRASREATVTRLVDAINEGRPADAVAAFHRPRIELVGLHRIYDGAEDVTKYLVERQRAFPDQRYELIALHHADDALVAEFWLMGTQSAEIAGIPPTGRGFRCRMAGFFEFDGDRLLCQRLYFDVGTIARQLA
jgi:predicted ester cyclase